MRTVKPPIEPTYLPNNCTTLPGII